MISFAKIEAEAAKRKGGLKALAKQLSKPLRPAQLREAPDAEFLAAMALQIFRAGFV